MSTELVTCWNGAMERSGAAPGLSRYEGGSSLHAFGGIEGLDHTECCRPWQRAARMPPLTEAQRAEAQDYIVVKGYGIRTIARAMRVSFKQIRTLRERLKDQGLLKAEALVRKSQ